MSGLITKNCTDSEKFYKLLQKFSEKISDLLNVRQKEKPNPHIMEEQHYFNNFIVTRPMVYNMLAQRAALKLELAGMKHSKGSVYAHIKRSYGWKGTRKAVYDKFDKTIGTLKSVQERGFQPFFHNGQIYPMRRMITEPAHNIGFIIPKDLYKSMLEHGVNEKGLGAVVTVEPELFDQLVDDFDKVVRSREFHTADPM